MQKKYFLYCKLVVRHDYYRDHTTSAIQLASSHTTKQILQQLDLHEKESPDGLELYAGYYEGKHWDDHPALDLYFGLSVQDPMVYRTSNLSIPSSGKSFLFLSNQETEGDFLSTDKRIGPSEQRDFNKDELATHQQSLQNSLGIVHIQLPAPSSDMVDPGQYNAPIFRLNFASRRVYPRYYLFAQTHTIRQVSLQRGGNPIPFEQAQTQVQGQLAQVLTLTDAINLEESAKGPEATIHLEESDTPVIFELPAPLPNAIEITDDGVVYGNVYVYI